MAIGVLGERLKLAPSPAGMAECKFESVAATIRLQRTVVRPAEGLRKRL